MDQGRRIAAPIISGALDERLIRTMMSGKDGKSNKRGVVVPMRPAAASHTTTPRAALETMSGYLKSQIALCNELENIADSLPDRVNAQDCLHVARSIYPTVRKAHDFEENELFPMLKSRFESDTQLLEALNRLHFEHWEDESFAEEVADGLKAFVAKRERANPEVLAYMLRGFFEGLRRHIAYEQDHLCPLVKQLEAADGSRS